jgi:thiol-disulfide isomerase/thioredoxin
MSIANQIGLGSASNLPVKPNSTTPLVISGKPAVVYIGADYCPYCSGTKWGLVVALMRFGNFSSLHYMRSSPSDIYPNTPTFTFYNSSYSSLYITFVGVEELTRTGQPLQSLTPFEASIFKNQDINNPNVIPQLKGGIPFIDFGNVSIQAAAGVMPSVIQQYNWSYILVQLKNPDSSIAQAIIGGANIFTAQICKMTNNSPSNVCSQQFIKSVNIFTEA